MKKACVLALAYLATAGSSLRADMPDYLAAAFRNTRWVAYSPTGPSPSPASESEIEKDLELLRTNGFGGIVTYGCDGLKKEIPKLAHKAGIDHVIVGVYNPLNEDEFRNAKDLARLVDGYCVGNEGIGQENRYSLEQLKARVKELRQWSGKPVTTSEQIEDYFSIPELSELGDWLFPNVHPWWHGKQREPEASRWTKEQVDKLRQMFPKKFAICKEVGLPTGSLDGSVKAPTEDVQLAYYLALEDLDVPFVYFEAYDQVWKRHDPVEPFWGMFKSDRTPKKIVSYVAGGRQRPKTRVWFTSIKSNKTLVVRKEPNGGFFDVQGASRSLDQKNVTLLMFVTTGEPAARGWFLQLYPSGVIDIARDGKWTAQGQIGNRTYPPRPDQKIGLRIMAVPKAEAAKLVEKVRTNPDRGLLPPDMPAPESEWVDEVQDLTLEIRPQAPRASK